MNRRHFLRAGAGLAGGAGLPGLARLAALGGGVLALPAHADGGDYRALVAVMLHGGNDGLNTLVPLDARYGQYQAVRGGLALSTAADNDRLLGPIVPIGAGDWGLHPRLEALAPFHADGSLAFLNNVGPLARPTTRANFAAWRYLNDTDKLPEALFSHNDQQKLWQNGASRTDASSVGATGWGARAAGSLDAGIYAFGGSTRFGAGSARSALNLPGPGTDLRGTLTAWQPSTPYTLGRKVNDTFLAMFEAPNADPLFARLASLRGAGLDAIQRLASIVAATPASGNAAYAAIDSAFMQARRTTGSASVAPYSQSLGKQLYQVAKMIASHSAVGGGRHIYCVQMLGFDTHSNQLAAQAALLSELGNGLAAFATAMRALGLHDSVTSFTLSDFGRTFKPNATGGTDHGWGNLQLMLGGAVKGGASYGLYPELALGGNDDAGTLVSEYQGRWIPTTAVSQYAATLLRWLGLGNADLATVLPDLARFASTDLGFMKA
ncbi:DUF1501 domain-containing protein [Derxia lacustris]|uniref:DUF1501 domain-containing protein n=1 Tax=Derxia lacustris TaxID=764842 RepID=UPI000A16DAEE|nr:DUF1501 domain-containing protein [Derxia lacustris]